MIICQGVEIFHRTDKCPDLITLIMVSLGKFCTFRTGQNILDIISRNTTILSGADCSQLILLLLRNNYYL